MAERMTSIRVRDDKTLSGFSDYGRKTRAEMITEYRRQAARDLARAQKILDTPDEGFAVHTHTGVITWRNVEELTE